MSKYLVIHVCHEDEQKSEYYFVEADRGQEAVLDVMNKTVLDYSEEENKDYIDQYYNQVDEIYAYLTEDEENWLIYLV